MSQNTELQQFAISEDVSHVEIAAVNYDQWVLTVALRLYRKSDQSVIGMVHVVFEEPEGFRVLNEDSMLRFPWPKSSKSGSFVHKISSGGWLEMEQKAGNIQGFEEAKEYLVVTNTECISVIAYADPKRVAG
jgi:hypothetical protein